ncbi:MAG: SOS response-associated peptidase [Candidatus Kariarchaeaceae archaeon]|jgi:putative SOS response-associated peptidase YedK
MPSRFCFYGEAQEIVNRFPVDEVNIDYYKYYNIKPTNRVVGIVQNEKNEVVKLRWGFVKGNKFFKARSETVHEKRLYGKAFRERRCLILANGFFEWKKEDGKSIPYYFKLKNNDIFAIAGVYNVHEDDEGENQYQFAVLTTEANDLVGEIFHRMPVILEKGTEEKWLDKEAESGELMEIMHPFDVKQMESYQVAELPSRKDRGPDTIKPIGVSTGLDDFF